MSYRSTDTVLIYIGFCLIAIGGANFARRGYVVFGVSALITAILITIAFRSYNQRVNGRRVDEEGRL